MLCDDVGDPFTARQLLSFFTSSELQVKTAGVGAGAELMIKTRQQTPWRFASRATLTRLLLTKLGRHSDLPEPQFQYEAPQMVTRASGSIQPLPMHLWVARRQKNLQKRQKLATQLDRTTSPTRPRRPFSRSVSSPG